MKNKLQCAKLLLMLFLAISFQKSFAQVTLKVTSEKKNYPRLSRLACDFINNDKYKGYMLLKINSRSSLVAKQSNLTKTYKNV